MKVISKLKNLPFNYTIAWLSFAKFILRPPPLPRWLQIVVRFRGVGNRLIDIMMIFNRPLFSAYTYLFSRTFRLGNRLIFLEFIASLSNRFCDCGLLRTSPHLKIRSSDSTLPLKRSQVYIESLVCFSNTKINRKRIFLFCRIAIHIIQK